MQKFKYFVILFIVFAQTAKAQQWSPIIPMPYCPVFQIEYKLEGNYQLRYKEFPDDTEYQYFERSLDDINNLSQLTNQLQEIANNYCSQTYEVTYRDDRILCMRDLGAQPFSSEYVNFLEELITVVDETRRNCEDVAPLIELQNHITNLDREGLLNFGRYRNFFKLFTGEATDRQIDHYYECGGRDGTPQFIENMILLEAQNACIFPSPPGMLSFDTTQYIARMIADDYPNLSLMSLNSKQGEITQKAVLALTRTVFDKNIKELLGEDTDTATIIDDLASYQNLRGEKEKRVMDHLTYITSVEAPLEIIDRVFPRMIHDSLAPVLPDSMSDEEKNNYIAENFRPEILENFNTCIASTRVAVENSRGRRTRDTIRNRQAIENTFCENNPDSCNANGCDRKVNFLTDRSDISDMDLVERCVFTSFQDKIDDIIGVILDAQRGMLDEHLNLTDAQFNNIKTEATTEIQACIDNDVKAAANQTYQEPLAVNSEAYLHIDATEFKTILNNCAKNLDESLTSDFGALIIANMDIVNQNFGDTATTTLRGIEVNSGSLEFARGIVSEVVADCNMAQSFRVYNNPELSQSTANCTPLIEIAAAGELVDTLVSDMLVENLVERPEIEELSNEFRACRELAASNARAAVLNPAHDNAIMDSSSGESYLANNHEFYNCTRDSVLSAVDLIADAQIDKTIREMDRQIQDKAYFESLKDEIKAEISQCFSSEMAQIESWPDFIAANDDGRFFGIIEGCTQRGVDYTLPLIIANETNLQINSLAGVNIIDQFQTQEIMDQISSQLALTYNISNADNKSSQDIIREAYQAFRAQNPDSTDSITEFTQAYVATAQLSTVDNLAGSILDQVIESSRPGFNFEELREVTSAQCFDQFYEQNRDNIEHIVNLASQNPSDSEANLKDVFVTILRNGLIHANLRGRLSQMMNQIRELCANPSNYQDLARLVEIGIGDDIIKAEVARQAQLSFENSINDQCQESMQDFIPRITRQEVDQLCSNPRESKRALIARIKSRINDPSITNLLEVFDKRFRESHRLIRSQFSSKTKIDEIFDNDPSLLRFIYSNFDRVVTGDQAIKDELSLKLMDSIFSDMSDRSFATEFTQVQLIAGVADSGYAIARAQVEETINNLNGIYRERARPIAMEEFHNRWTFNGVSHYMNLRQLEQSDRSTLLQTVYRNSIRSRIDPSISDERRENLELATSRTVNGFLDQNRLHPNPDHRPARTIYSLGGPVYIPAQGPTHLNFSERLAYDITEETTDRVISSYGDDVIDFLNIFD